MPHSGCMITQSPNEVRGGGCSVNSDSVTQKNSVMNNFVIRFDNFFSEKKM